MVGRAVKVLNGRGRFKLLIGQPSRQSEQTSKVAEWLFHQYLRGLGEDNWDVGGLESVYAINRAVETADHSRSRRRGD